VTFPTPGRRPVRADCHALFTARQVTVQKGFVFLPSFGNKPDTRTLHPGVMSNGPLDGFVVGVTADRRANEQAELLRRLAAGAERAEILTDHPLLEPEDITAAKASLAPPVQVGAKPPF